MNIKVRRIKATEANKLRDCRLRALKDSPHAFGVKLLDEQKRPFSDFESDAHRLSLSEKSTMFLGHSADDVYGQIGVFIDADKAYICAMWVSPKARGLKVGTRLVKMASTWLVERGHTEVNAWVVDNNEVALSFYKQLGFQATLEKQTLASNASQTETLYRFSNAN